MWYSWFHTHTFIKLCIQYFIGCIHTHVHVSKALATAKFFETSAFFLRAWEEAAPGGCWQYYSLLLSIHTLIITFSSFWLWYGIYSYCVAHQCHVGWWLNSFDAPLDVCLPHLHASYTKTHTCTLQRGAYKYIPVLIVVQTKWRWWFPDQQWRWSWCRQWRAGWL